MTGFLGIDTSNYTTSAAFINTNGEITQEKKLLPVKKGEKGIRQSDAVFHHTVQLPMVMDSLYESLGDTPKIEAIGASARPRRDINSYMPCFHVGNTNAHNIGKVLGVPVYTFSHQEGHVAAALYSSGRQDLFGKRFLAFHLSGGTTESLLIEPGPESILTATCIGRSLDLKAGQAVDRTGLMLGLSFPCGPELEKLALKSKEEFKIRPSLKGFDCSLSGIENQCMNKKEKGMKEEDIALFCLESIGAAVNGMAEALLKEYPGLPLVFSGGVMSNSIIRKRLESNFDCAFAEPAFSADNAAGTALLTSLTKDF